MSVEKNAPDIRFKGFGDSWVEEKIQELIDRQSIISHLDGNHGELYPRSNEFSDHGIPYISANDFVSGFISFDRCKYLPLQKAQKFKKGIAKDGDILFAHNATVGPVAKLETSYDFVILSTTATYFRCDNKSLINDYFLPALSNKKFVQQYSRVMAQSTRNQVPITVQRTFTISMPESCSEQTQIGNYFQKLDNLINQHQQKHDKLSSIKKAMLEKMFPKQGETVPEIRFKGFGGEWRETDLAGACSNFQSGKFIKAEDIKENGAYPVYGGNGLRGFCSAYNYEGIYALIGRQGALCGNMNLSHGKAFFTEHAIAVQANKDCDTLFLFYSLGTMNLGQYSGQSAQPGLSVTNLIKLIILVPEYREQNEIGNYFQKLDTLINQHQQQITKLNNIKQACLSKMFV